MDIFFSGQVLSGGEQQRPWPSQHRPNRVRTEAVAVIVFVVNVVASFPDLLRTHT